MSLYVIPLIIVFVVLYGFIKRINVYDSFISGVKEGLRNCINIFPMIFAMTLSVNVILSSNIIRDISKMFPCVFIPKEIIPMILVRPMSGGSSIAILNNLYKVYGTDSYIGRICSLVMGCTDTTIYIITMYFSSVGIKKARYAYVVGLITDLVCLFTSIIVIRLWFY